MAMMPEGSKAIYNAVGTAPGILVEEGKVLILVLPGVPSEMMDIFERVEDMMRSRAPKLYYSSLDIIVKGVPESDAAPVIEEAMRKYDVYVKSHPSGQEVMRPVLRINVTSSSPNEDEAERNVRAASEFISNKLRERGGIIEA